MASTTMLHVRLDVKAMRQLDELTAHYAKQAEPLGVTLTRSDAVRVILRAAHADMQDKLAGKA
jgi:hypothetical protein